MTIRAILQVDTSLGLINKNNIYVSNKKHRN